MPELRVVILDYGVGNFRSLSSALGFLRVTHEVATDANDVTNATHIILPGVGSFGVGMKCLRDGGFADVLIEAAGNTCILGVCLGMQMLFEGSAESPGISGLGLLEGYASPVSVGQDDSLQTHMGFSTVHFRPGSALFRGIPQDSDFYFVHSYAFDSTFVPEHAATATFGNREFLAAFTTQKGIAGTQFHPERSQGGGLRLLRNFIAL